MFLPPPSVGLFRARFYCCSLGFHSSCPYLRYFVPALVRSSRTHSRCFVPCSIYDKIKFVRAMACAPSFTCAPHESIRALQPRLRETFSKCPLQTLHYYDISTNKFGPKQTSIYSLTQRLLQGDIGCHDRMDIPDRAQWKRSSFPNG